MANINQQWRRFVAVGCVHSVFACPDAVEAVLTFCDRYRPDTRIDLGDVHDMTAFRSGAKGTPDESADIDKDYDAGVEWLRLYRPTHRTKGNHDNRIDKLLEHPNAIIRKSATDVLNDIAAVDEANGTRVKRYYQREWWKFGDTKFAHGWMFNVNAVRDHAESYGKCVIAHLHVPGEARGRRDDSPIGWCVGTLADPSKLTYAHENRNWLTWAHGFVWGEYSDTETVVRLERRNCANGGPETWRLPL